MRGVLELPARCIVGGMDGTRGTVQPCRAAWKGAQNGGPGSQVTEPLLQAIPHALLACGWVRVLRCTAAGGTRSRWSAGSGTRSPIRCHQTGPASHRGGDDGHVNICSSKNNTTAVLHLHWMPGDSSKPCITVNSCDVKYGAPIPSPNVKYGVAVHHNASPPQCVTPACSGGSRMNPEAAQYRHPQRLQRRRQDR